MKRLLASCLLGLVGSAVSAQDVNLTEQFLDSLTRTPPARDSMLYWVFRDMWRVTSVPLTSEEREYLRQLRFQVDADAVRKESARAATERVCRAVERNADAISLGVLLNGIQEAQESGLQRAYTPLYEQLPSELKRKVDGYLDELMTRSTHGHLAIDYTRTARTNPDATQRGAKFACERHRDAIAREPEVIHRNSRELELALERETLELQEQLIQQSENILNGN